MAETHNPPDPLVEAECIYRYIEAIRSDFDNLTRRGHDVIASSLEAIRRANEQIAGCPRARRDDDID